MAIRFAGRYLNGSQGRQVRKALERGGLNRKFHQSILRGDTAASLNRILQQVGYDLKKPQIASIIGESYSYRTYKIWDKAVGRRYGEKGRFNHRRYSTSFFSQNPQLTIEYVKQNGDIGFATVNIYGERYNNILQAIESVVDEIPNFLKGSDIDFTSFKIARINYRS